MPSPYSKPFLPVTGQVALLQQRGMSITDPAKAAAVLERIGYYRLSGYWYPMRESRLVLGIDGRARSKVLDQFRPGTTLSQVLDLYVFDKRLRLLFLDAIERIEVALRVDIALMLGARDPLAHRKPSFLHGNFAKKVDPKLGTTQHADWMSKLDKLEVRSKEDFVQHFRETYSGNLPIWVAIELFDFGLLSVLLSGLPVNDQVSLASKYGFPRRELLTSWIRSINYVRNLCAHHSRLWNRSLTEQGKPPQLGEIPLLDHLASDGFAHSRLYSVAAVMQFLMRTINPQSSWGNRLSALMATFPTINSVVVGQSGFPSDWAQEALWT